MDKEELSEREFMKIRRKYKTGTALRKAAANLPKLKSHQETTEEDRDAPIVYKKVTCKGELYSEHPEPSNNPVTFNQQVSTKELNELRAQCTPKKFVEVVRYLPEYNYSIPDTLQYVNNTDSWKKSPCLECGVAGCLRTQQRWQIRVLHGCYPQEPVLNFQHDKSGTKASCYFVKQSDKTGASQKYLDAIADLIDIEQHLKGKECKLKN